MSFENQFAQYRGDGSARSGTPPEFTPLVDLDDAEGYVAEGGLPDAVNVAIVLGMPLLVTGEPGTGKTRLAASVAHELALGEPLELSAKTTSTAQDLFYRYDALRHFHAAQRADVSARDFITFEALGLATLLSMPPAEANPYLDPKHHGIGPRRSVVLIDEIDKAPRDFPNDILREIETMSFRVPELGLTFPRGVFDRRYRPIVIITSNSEKHLPDAFLRRCVYFHIEFPRPDRLEEIIRRRFRHRETWFTPARLRAAIDVFQRVRELPLQKKPATGELLQWVHLLMQTGVEPPGVGAPSREAIAFTASVLAKNSDDIRQLEQALRAAS